MSAASASLGAMETSLYAYARKHHAAHVAAARTGGLTAIVHCGQCHRFFGNALAFELDYSPAEAAAMSTAWYQAQVGAAICPLHRAEEIKQCTLDACYAAFTDVIPTGRPNQPRVDAGTRQFKSTRSLSVVTLLFVAAILSVLLIASALLVKGGRW